MPRAADLPFHFPAKNETQKKDNDVMTGAHPIVFASRSFRVRALTGLPSKALRASYAHDAKPVDACCAASLLLLQRNRVYLVRSALSQVAPHGGVRGNCFM